MKKDITKILALIIALLCMLSLFSCNKKSNNSKDTANGKTSNIASARKEIKLPFSSEDGLDPYKAKSLINQSLFPLLYESLYKNDGSYKPEPLVAESGSIDGTQVIVQLGSKSFSDGSIIAAKDVVYSFDKAKASTYYAGSLANFADAKEDGTRAVKFTLSTNDTYALSCLDFAIVKNGTSSNDATATTIPTGSGIYAVDNSGANAVLKENSYYTGTKPKQSKIQLVNITDSNSVAQSLVIGNINCLFDDLSSGTYTRINASTLDITINNLIYLGINKGSSMLSNPEFRKDLSIALNRDNIVNSGYQGHAVKTFTPFNPDWYALKSLKQSIKDADKNAANTYISGNKSNTNLTLIVNSENALRVAAAQEVASQLNSLGLKVTVSQKTFAEYTAAINSGGYDLYIGEVKLNDNMDLTPVMDTNDASYAYYQQMKNGTLKLQDFLDKFNETTPFIPLCYRMGVLAFSREIAVEVKGYENNVYQNIDKWYIKS